MCSTKCARLFTAVSDFSFTERFPDVHSLLLILRYTIIMTIITVATAGTYLQYYIFDIRPFISNICRYRHLTRSGAYVYKNI